MGLDFLQKKNNAFKTRERLSMERELGGETLFSRLGHLERNMFTCLDNSDRTYDLQPGQVCFIIELDSGLAVIGKDAPTEVMGTLMGESANELKSLLDETPGVPHVLLAKVSAIDGVAPVFTVEVIKEDSADVN